MQTDAFTWTDAGARHSTRYDVTGQGRELLMLPALSSISSRAEMHPLAALLGASHRCVIPDWPGFGAETGPEGRLTPERLLAFLRAFVRDGIKQPAIAVAAGHSAAYLMTVAREMPGTFSHIVLAAPTWRGPLPTAMGEKPRLWRSIRRLIEAPVVGQPFYRMNVKRPVIAKMMTSHVYADPGFVTDARLAEKEAITQRPRARFATAAFVTGGLDLFNDAATFHGLFKPPLPAPTLLLIGRSTPRKSRAAMDALARIDGLASELIPGALAAHEEYPQAVAEAVRRFVS